eukprot:jgi/Botrbrau1/8797/Bobra.0330s0028.1
MWQAGCDTRWRVFSQSIHLVDVDIHSKNFHFTICCLWIIMPVHDGFSHIATDTPILQRDINNDCSGFRCFANFNVSWKKSFIAYLHVGPYVERNVSSEWGLQGRLIGWRSLRINTV